MLYSENIDISNQGHKLIREVFAEVTDEVNSRLVFP